MINIQVTRLSRGHLSAQSTSAQIHSATPTRAPESATISCVDRLVTPQASQVWAMVRPRKDPTLGAARCPWYNSGGILHSLVATATAHQLNWTNHLKILDENC
jgi:hypothetical protein